MKRKLLFLFFVFFISCKHKEIKDDFVAPLLEERTEEIRLTDEQNRDVYLCSLMNMQSYCVEDEKIEKGLLNFLEGLDEKGVKEKLSLKKINDDLFEISKLSFFSIDDEIIEEDIRLSLYKIESGEKSGFAITCNDLRVGQILALVEEGEFDEDNPFIEFISSNIKAYVNSTVQDWHKLKNKKDGQYKERSVWEGLVASGKYTYENLKVNSKSSPRFLLKTKWNQWPIYNDVIVKLKGGDYPAGCVSVAIAQIMAFHEYPKSYYGRRWENFNAFKPRLEKYFPIAKDWNGKYDWWILTWSEKAEDISEKYPIYRLQLASLMYEIAESCDASYSEKETTIYTEDFAKGLLFHDYITGVCTKTPMPVDPDYWKRCKRTRLPPWVMEEMMEIIGLKSFENTLVGEEGDSEIRSVGPSGNKIRYTNYSFESVKSSIDNLCPVLIRGTAINKKATKATMSTGGNFKIVGHAWVIDGYCNITCDAVHKETNERKTITADYVHCNPGWDGQYNGYYISNVFTFGIDGKATIEDNKIRSSWPGSNNYYKYDIKIFPNLIPKSKLGRYSEYPLYYNWRPLW